MISEGTNSFALQSDKSTGKTLQLDCFASYTLTLTLATIKPDVILLFGLKLWTNRQIDISLNAMPIIFESPIVRIGLLDSRPFVQKPVAMVPKSNFLKTFI